LNAEGEPVRWCEGDAYDQLFPIRLLASLPVLPGRLELIEISRVPGIRHLSALVNRHRIYRPAWLWPQRRPLGEDAFKLASEAWYAYAATDAYQAHLEAQRHPTLPPC
jgi:hypothetical protein